MKKIYLFTLLTIFGISQMWAATLTAKVAVGSGKGTAKVEIFSRYGGGAQSTATSTDGTVKTITYGTSAFSWGYSKFTGTAATGYSFEGWYTNSACTSGRQTGNPYETDDSGSSSRTDQYWAKFTPNNYTVTYNAQGGSCSANTLLVTFDAAYGTLAVPTRDGYTFDGWYTAASGGSIVTSSTIVRTASDHTLYAHWTALSYTITFDGNGSSDGSMESVEMQYGAAQQLPANTFTRVYTVTFDANGGTCEVTSANAVYTFAGWEDRTGIVYNGMTYDYTAFDAPYYANAYSDLYAAFGYNKYSLIQHYVNSGKNEGRSAKGENPGLYPDGATLNNMTTTDGTTVELFAHWADGAIILPEVTNGGLILDGWYEGETRIGNPGEAYYPNADAALTARWAEKITPLFELSKTTIELDQTAVLTLTNTDQPVVEISPEGIVNYVAETGELMAIGIGEVSITVTQAETEMLAAKQETLVLTVEKKTASLSVLLNGIAQSSIVVNQGKSATVEFVKESDAEVEVTTLSGEQYAGYVNGSVKAGELGTAVFRATLPESDTYKAAYVDFTVTTQQDSKHVPFVLTAANHGTYEGPKSSSAAWNSDGYRLCDGGWSTRDDYMVITFTGIPDKLYFDKSLEKSLGQLPGTYKCEVFESADGSNWGDAIWTHNERVEEKNGNVVQLSSTTRYIKFAYHGTVYCNYKNIEVTELKRFAPTVSSLNFGTGYISEEREEMTFGLNYANAGHHISLSVNDDHFTVSPTLISDAGGEQVGTWQPITVSYNTDEVHKASNAQITISDERGNVAYVSLAAETKKYETLVEEFPLVFCEGDSAEYRGKWYYAAGMDVINIEDAVRDTTINVTITVNQPSASSEEKTITFGDAEEWNGINLSDSTVGQHIVTFVTTNEAGCDSTVTLTLTVNKLETLNVPVELSFCEGGSEWYRGTEYTEAGAFDVPVEDATRDTLYQVHVTIPQPTSSTEEKTITFGDAEDWNGINLSDSTVGQHIVTFVTTNEAGCDSTVTLTLTVNKIETLRVDTAFAFCAGGSETFHGKIYTEAVEADEIQAEGETRDTLYVVNVTVLQPSFVEEDMTIIVGTDTAWNGIALKDSTVGVYTIVYETMNVAGCDSTVTLTLTVNKMDTLKVDTAFAFCEGGSEEFHGKTYTEAIKDTILAIGETRDTLYFVNVTVLQPSFVEEDMTIIVGTDTAWNGIALKDSTVGVYAIVYETTNVAGCDSTVTLTLTVNKMDTLMVEYPIAFCAGDSAEYRGRWYYESGEDTILVEDAIQDTLIYVTIAVLPTDLSELKADTLHVGDTLFIEADTWYLGEELVADTIIVPTEAGEFDLTQTLKNEADCDSVIVRHIVVEEKPVTPDTPTAIETVGAGNKAAKVLRDGVIYIRREGKEFTIDGRVVK